MTISIIDADTAIPQINVEDITDTEGMNKLSCVVQLFQYQTEYWECHKRYAPTLEALIEDIDPVAYKFMKETLTRAKKYWKANGEYPTDIEDLKGWEEIN